jgi:hypothetical protein
MAVEKGKMRRGTCKRTYRGAPRTRQGGFVTDKRRKKDQKYIEKIAACELSPYWKIVDPNDWEARMRIKLMKWGLCEFEWKSDKMLVGRLTTLGVQARDYFHRMKAEESEKKLKEKRHDYYLSKHADD